MSPRGLERRKSRLSRAQWGMLCGVVALLLVLELVLVYTYVGLGRASDRYENQGASATLLSNVQRETLKLALLTERSHTGFRAALLQRDVLEHKVAIAAIAATDPDTERSLEIIRRHLRTYDAKLAALGGVEPEEVAQAVAPVLERMELETKHAFDRAELNFYQTASAALSDQRQSQVFMLAIGGLLFVLVIPLGFSLHRLFDSQLKRLSAFPRLSPFPVVELAPSGLKFANSAAESLAADLSGEQTVEALLPPSWPALVREQLANRELATATREVEVGGRTLAWSFIALGSLGIVHGYGDDVTERKRAEETVERQARLNGYQALHDSLTGLGNRRKLMEDGERKLPLASSAAPLGLAIFDLDGFKGYNDTFGHPAGDALLARLGSRLRSMLPREAVAYRMGGDEFCVLAELADVDGVLATASEALSEEGESFSISSSAGAATIPDEAETIVKALQLADQRLYANKRSSRSSAGAQTRDALAQVLIEQDPFLASHVSNVAGLAAATARRLGLSDEEVSRIRLAAELHDVGKSAIPSTILEKPGALDESEWAFVKRHTLIGERILAAAPALAGVAPLVRSSHERIDGRGYPDGLSGDEIPLAARIVAIADAFDAMIADRPYRKGLSIAGALAELRRCAGTQFDGLVVAVFADVVEERERLASALRKARPSRASRQPLPRGHALEAI